MDTRDEDWNEFNDINKLIIRSPIRTEYKARPQHATGGMQAGRGLGALRAGRVGTPQRTTRPKQMPCPVHLRRGTAARRVASAVARSGAELAGC